MECPLCVFSSWALGSDDKPGVTLRTKEEEKRWGVGRDVCYLIWKPLAGIHILKRREFFLFVEFIKKTGSGLDLKWNVF